MARFNALAEKGRWDRTPRNTIVPGSLPTSNDSPLGNVPFWARSRTLVCPENGASMLTSPPWLTPAIISQGAALVDEAVFADEVGSA